MAKRRTTYKAAAGLKPSAVLADNDLRGLRYIGGEHGTYAQFRWRDPASGKWKSKGLGRLPTEAEGEAEALAAFSENDAAGASWHPDHILEGVRRKARKLVGNVRAHGHPDGSAGARTITLQQALDLHLASKERSPRTVEGYRALVDRYLSDWKERPLARIGRVEVRDRHRRITKDHGPYSANGTMRLFRAVWNRARRQFPDLGDSPTGNVDWCAEQRRDAAIRLADLPQWYREVMALGNGIRRDYYLLAVLTGLRRETVSAIHRDHLDLEAETLHVPKPKGGADRAFTLPLSDFAVDVIERRIAENAAWWENVNKWRRRQQRPPVQPNGFLFPAHSASGHVSEPKASEGDKFTVPFTVHGLRNTYLSAAAGAGVNPYHAKLLVNHSLPKGDVTGGYVSSDVDALRPSQQAVTDFLRAAMAATQVGPAEAQKVVALPRRRA